MNLNDSPPVLGRSHDLWHILTIFILLPYPTFTPLFPQQDIQKNSKSLFWNIFKGRLDNQRILMQAKDNIIKCKVQRKVNLSTSVSSPPIPKEPSIQSNPPANNLYLMFSNLPIPKATSLKDSTSPNTYSKANCKLISMNKQWRSLKKITQASKGSAHPMITITWPACFSARIRTNWKRKKNKLWTTGSMAWRRPSKLISLSTLPDTSWLAASQKLEKYK